MGRNKKENEAIQALSAEKDLLMTSMSVPGPLSLVLGFHGAETLQLIASITASYSDAEGLDFTEIRVTGKNVESVLSARVNDKKRFRTMLI